MRVTKVEILRSKRPVTLPLPWEPAWTRPNGPATTQFSFSFYKVHTDQGLIGYGPNTGHTNPAILEGLDPTMVGAFWEARLSGRRSGNAGQGAAGLEIALWDLIGKAAGLPVFRLQGAQRERILVYAATSRLMEPEALADHVLAIAAEGFKAVKLRLHRPDPWEDLAAVEAVRLAVGEELTILVDANQNNYAAGYDYWSRRTAQQMAQALDELDVYYLEEPLPRTDVEGLAEIAAMVDMFVAGGEHTPTVYDFLPHLEAGAYDIVQPDVILGGNFGIIGLRRVALLAESYGRLIVPHVCSGSSYPLGLPATLQAMATVPNCPLVEYPYDPPILTVETQQTPLLEPLLVEEDGCVALPEGPGLGVALDETQFEVG